MVDKIVQLTDGDENNIFPVAGALKSGSVTASTINDGAVTTAKVADGAITAAKINLSTLGGNYSTSEIDTGYTWVDGSHIYKKTVDTGALPDATSKNVAHGISGLSRIIRMDGYAYHGGSAITVPLPYAGVTPTNTITINATSTVITLEAGADRTGYTESYVTLYYTKTP